jgi:hypothetical protein
MKYVKICTLALLAAVPALAQNDMSWVSHSGSDSYPCSLALPCADFQTAYSKTNNNGIVKALDAGQYGTVYISKPITIDGNGVGASIQVTGSGVDGVHVYSGSGQVQIRSLAIHMSCTSCQGIYSQNNTLIVQNVMIDGTPVLGVQLDGGGTATIQNVTVTGAGTSGIYVTDAAATISDSVLRNSNTGIYIQGYTVVPRVLIERSKMVTNILGLGVFNFGTAAPIAWISDCVITGNTTGTETYAGGQIITLRNNTWTDNTTDGSTLFSTSLR